MKRLLLILAAAAMVWTAQAQEKRTAVQVAGIAFYNLENLFDTIPNNAEGRDEEFTPAGQRQWDGRKYRQKIHNLAYAISRGIAGRERNRKPFGDGGCDKPARTTRPEPAHRPS